MRRIRRIRNGNLFIQVMPTRDGQQYLAWSSEQPSDDPVTAPGEVHFIFDQTESGAIEKLKGELENSDNTEGRGGKNV